jgi:hypothetical protein
VDYDERLPRGGGFVGELTLASLHSERSLVAVAAFVNGDSVHLRKIDGDGFFFRAAVPERVLRPCWLPSG